MTSGTSLLILPDIKGSANASYLTKKNDYYLKNIITDMETFNFLQNVDYVSFIHPSFTRLNLHFQLQTMCMGMCLLCFRRYLWSVVFSQTGTPHSHSYTYFTLTVVYAIPILYSYTKNSTVLHTLVYGTYLWNQRTNWLVSSDQKRYIVISNTTEQHKWVVCVYVTHVQTHVSVCKLLGQWKH